MREIFYYKMRQKFIKSCVPFFTTLQNAIAITKCFSKNIVKVTAVILTGIGISDFNHKINLKAKLL